MIQTYCPLTLIQIQGLKQEGFLQDKNAAGDVPQDVNVIIPLNRYSFFEELEDKMLVPMQLQSNLTLRNNDELINLKK